MRFLPSRLLGLLLGLLIVHAAGAASADGGSAEALKKRGNQAMLELNYADALDAYRQALWLDPSDASLYYNLGRALQARAEFPEALDAFEAFRAKASPELRARVPKLDELVDDVRLRVGLLSITCSAELPDAKVVVTFTAGRAEASSAPGFTASGCGVAARPIRLGLPSKNTDVEVRLEHPTQQAQPVQLTVTGGAPPASVALRVVARATSGLLRVRVVPSGALVAVDGKAYGNAPVELPLPAGPHVLDVTADRYDAARVPVVVDLGREKDVDIVLTTPRPITSRWWFWAGAAVLAAGAGVTAYILVARPEREARDGTIDPGQIEAPLVRF